MNVVRGFMLGRANVCRLSSLIIKGLEEKLEQSLPQGKEVVFSFT